MLDALKKLWKLVVKALTLGLMKGDAYLDSKKDPVLEIENNIARLRQSQKDMRHRFFEIEKERLQKKQSLTSLEEEIKQGKDAIRQMLKDGKEELARYKARSMMHKENSLELNRKRVEQLEERKSQIEVRVAKVDADIEVLDSKKHDLATMISMRDDTKASTGIGDDDWKSIQEILDDAEKHITEVTNEDSAYQTTHETFNDDSQPHDAGVSTSQ